MTKKEAKVHKIEWNKALTEGRVVKYNGTTFRSFLTHEDALSFIADLPLASYAHIVDVA